MLPSPSPAFLFLQHLVGRLIGKQGRYVSFLKQNSGSKIYISTLPYTQEFQICHIEGELGEPWTRTHKCPLKGRGGGGCGTNVETVWLVTDFSPGTQQQVDKALSLIGKKFKDLDLTNLYAPPQPPLTLPSLPMTSWVRMGSPATTTTDYWTAENASLVFWFLSLCRQPKNKVQALWPRIWLYVCIICCCKLAVDWVDSCLERFKILSGRGQVYSSWSVSLDPSVEWCKWKLIPC